MHNDVISLDDFNRIAQIHCQRWEPRSLEVVRALLVAGEKLSIIANKFHMKPQQANVLRTRFLERMRREAIVKLPAQEFMQSVTPNSPILEPFKNDIKQLLKGGYSETQIIDFLHANDVKITVKELTIFLGAMNENFSFGKPKRRRG